MGTINFQNVKNFVVLIFAVAVAFSCSDKGKNKLSQEAIIQAENNDSSQASDIFNVPEISVWPSPAQEQSISLNEGENVTDYDVSPAGPVVAIAISDKQGNSTIKFWQIGQKTISETYSLTDGYKLRSLTWHPLATALFAIAVKDNIYHILRIEKGKNGWETTSIFSTAQQLRRLVTGPRPFTVAEDTGNSNRVRSYRLFFGMGYGENLFRIASVSEHGKRFYQVLGPDSMFTVYPDEGAPPSTMKASWALPVAFHPYGKELIWQDKEGNFNVAAYRDQEWDTSLPIHKNIPRLGTLTPLPNGTGLLHWQKDKPGIGVYFIAAANEEKLCAGYDFSSTPSSVPDGKGIVGLTMANGRAILNYVPIQVPLPDVVNAWMFAENADDLNLFQKNYGLFRSTNLDQLFKLYETENYMCNSYDPTTPTRPYLVTADIFWELYGAAYEGLFIIKERDQAVPNFWNFVTAANAYFKKSGSQSKWAPVFSTLTALADSNSRNPEALKIRTAGGESFSDVLKKSYDYSILKPRGHYTASWDMKSYFMAFKYFTTAFRDSSGTQSELNMLAPEIRNFAKKWIESYMGFISTSRTPLAWKGIQNTPPLYNQYPGTGNTLFPLSWGFDNETLYASVYHNDVPIDKQIIGKNGEQRLTPSGLDIAAAMGNGFAESLSESEYQTYPPLRKVMATLKQSFRKYGDASASNNLYDKWLSALAVQWLDTLSSPNGKLDEGIWRAKRLQTGLASWATLRHATGLVNETGGAECGEGGFEEILMRAPRGYVEPDPQTFAALADLFETSVRYISNTTSERKDVHESYENPKESLYNGIVKRLKETAADARLFQQIAEKEKRGEPLTNTEYEKILFVGRVAEHNFLIFKSLQNKEYALSVPDPMPKVAEVFGQRPLPYLIAAVGNPMEWDNVVPYFGRHEIVKGVTYSYYELTSGKLWDDQEWNQQVNSREYQPWIKPYVTQHDVSYPAITGY